MPMTLNELSLLLGEALYQKHEVHLVARDLGLPLALLDLDGPSVSWWANALTLAHLRDRLDALLDALRARLPAEALRIERPLEWTNAATAHEPVPDGTPYAPAWDVGRLDVEREVLKRLRGPRTTTVLVAPDGYGRSWFLRRIAVKLRADDPPPQVVLVGDFDVSGTNTESFRSLLSAVLKAAGRDPEEIRSLWKPRATPADNVWKLVEGLARQTARRLVLAIDVPTAIWRSKAHGAFFTMLRGIANATDSPWDKVCLLAAYSTTPALWNRDLHASPLNVAPTELRDLTLADVHTLAQRHRLAWSVEDLEAVHGSLGGHPRLLRQLMYHCHERARPARDVLGGASDPEGLFFNHVQTLRGLLQTQGLMDDLRRVADEGRRPPTADAFQTLYAAGLIRKSADGDAFELRYGLLRSVIAP